MLHFAACLARSDPPADPVSPSRTQVSAWLVVAISAVVAPWVLFAGIAGSSAWTALDLKALVALSWPIALGAAGFVVLRRISLPRIPEGDIVVLAEAGAPLVASVSAACAKLDAAARNWGMAGLAVTLLVLAFAGAQWG
jgi:hypothetical protein